MAPILQGYAHMNYLITLVGLVLVALIGFLIRRLFHRKDKLSNKVDSREVRITKLETRQDSLEKSFEKLDYKLDRMPEKIVNLLQTRSSIIKSSSPPQLTSKGQKIAKESGIDNIIEKHKDEWLAELANLDSYSLFDKWGESSGFF